MTYEDLIYERCAAFINGIDIACCPDVYVLALSHGYYFQCHSPEKWPEPRAATYHQNVIQILLNTETNYHECIHEASDAEEARWNPSFWIDEPSQEIAPCDFEELLLRDEWCSHLNIPIDRLDDSGHPIYEQSAINRASIEACAIAIEKLHRNGVIQAKFSAPTPILILYDLGVLAAEATNKANPHSKILTEAIHTLVSWHGSKY